jgi:tetratricopeptide (TPR) repeat protein
MKRMWLCLIGMSVLSCADSDSRSPLDEGWSAFEAGDYTSAVTVLTEARNKKPDDPEIRSALGWALMRLDMLTEAESEFEAGALLINAPADLYAGRAFVLNAQKQYGASNTSISQALSLQPAWLFLHESGLDHEDLAILKAENHFVLGEFQDALTAVQTVNASFTADVATDAGRGQLAAEIERLRS